MLRIEFDFSIACIIPKAYFKFKSRPNHINFLDSIATYHSSPFEFILKILKIVRTTRVKLDPIAIQTIHPELFTFFDPITTYCTTHLYLAITAFFNYDTMFRYTKKRKILYVKVKTIIL